MKLMDFADPSDNPEVFASIVESFQHRCGLPLGRNADDATDSFNDDCGYLSKMTFANNSGLLVEARAKVAMLKKYRWLDRQTKSVRLGMTLYSENLKRWVSVEMVLEVNLAGGFMSSHRVDVLHLSPFDSKDWSWRMVLDLILQLAFVFFTILYTNDAGLKLKQTRTHLQRARFRVNTMTTPTQFGLELTCLMLNWAVLIKWTVWLSMDFSRLEEYSLSGDEKVEATAAGFEYPDITAGVDWEEGWRSINGLNVMMQTLRGIAYFQLSKSGHRLVSAVNRAIPQLAMYVPIYVAVMIGFALSGHLMFGIRDGEWSLFSYAFYNVFEMQLNLYSAYNVYDKSQWSVVWIYSLMLLSVVMLTNVFVAIIMATWEAITDEQEELEVPGGIRQDLRLIGVPLSIWRKAEDILGESHQKDLSESAVAAIVFSVVPEHHAQVIMERLWEQLGTSDSLDGVDVIVPPPTPIPSPSGSASASLTSTPRGGAALERAQENQWNVNVSGSARKRAVERKDEDVSASFGGVLPGHEAFSSGGSSSEEPPQRSM